MQQQWSNDLIRRAAAAIAMAVFGLHQVVSQGTQEQRKWRMVAAAVVLWQPCCAGMRAPCHCSALAAVLSQQGVAPMRHTAGRGYCMTPLHNILERQLHRVALSRCYEWALRARVHVHPGRVKWCEL